MRIGILGGTFNPPHLGHLICAQEAQVQLALDRVILVPAGRPPHKRSLEDEPGPRHRLELCRAATEGDARFAVDDLELRRAGPSYTADTLRELHARTPESELYLIVGGDVAAGLPGWHEPREVVALATLAIAGRRGTTRASIDAALERLSGAVRAEFFQMPAIGISSTEIRRRVRAAAPIRYMVPDAVERYISEHRLYGGPAQ